MDLLTLYAQCQMLRHRRERIALEAQHSTRYAQRIDHQSRHKPIAIRPYAIIEKSIVAHGHYVIGIEAGKEPRRIWPLDPIGCDAGLFDGDTNHLEAGVQNVIPSP